MTNTEYQAHAKRVIKAYKTLVAAAEGAEYFDKSRILRAADGLQSGLDALAGQVCRDCQNTGYLKGKAIPADAEYGVAYSCSHRNVQRFVLYEEV